jgi:hypothetical protein
MALLQGEDPLAAARKLLGARDGHGITVHERRVTVAITPHLPFHLNLPQLRGHATADAGPEPRP